jgi:sugar phosphate isomerase/epimerase
MGIPAANGGFWGTSLAAVQRIVAATGLKCNFENHPEKSAEEIRGKIEGGSPGIGLCINTGWLGTNGVNAAAAIRALKETGYQGWYSWEDEPEDRNPMEIAAPMREWLLAQLQQLPPLQEPQRR